MQRLLSERKHDKWDLDVGDLPCRQDVASPTESDADVEILRVAKRPGYDVFIYKIVLNKQTHQYWIVRSGGFAGRTEVFGPGHLK